MQLLMLETVFSDVHHNLSRVYMRMQQVNTEQKIFFFYEHNKPLLAPAADKTVAARGSELLPIIAQRLSSALYSFGSDSASHRLGEAIGKQRVAPLLQNLLLRHMTAFQSSNTRKTSDRRTGGAATVRVAGGTEQNTMIAGDAALFRAG